MTVERGDDDIDRGFALIIVMIAVATAVLVVTLW